MDASSLLVKMRMDGLVIYLKDDEYIQFGGSPEVLDRWRPVIKENGDAVVDALSTPLEQERFKAYVEALRYCAKKGICGELARNIAYCFGYCAHTSETFQQCTRPRPLGACTHYQLEEFENRLAKKKSGEKGEKMYKINLIDKLSPLQTPGECSPSVVKAQHPVEEATNTPLPKEKSEDIINYFKQEEVVKWLAMYGDK